MRNLFALFGAATIAFVALGWYLDWYKLTRQPSQAGTQSVRFDLNGDKTTGDLKKIVERGGEILDRLRENNNSGDGQNKPAPQSEQGPASQFFSPPSATGSQAQPGPWKSLDTAPPPPVSNSAAQLQPPRR